MRYKDQINVKLYSYNNGAFVLQAIIDDYQEISFSHNLYEAGDFTITINYNIPNALKFERGMFVQFGNDAYMFGEILRISDAIGEDGKGSQIRTITGKDSRYIFKRRIIKNLNNEENWAMTAKGEICLRELVKAQCGSGAEAKRQLPISNTIPSSSNALGKEYSVAESFSNLYDTLVTIATQSEIGWRIKFDGSLTLECFQGSDLSNQVQFSTDFDSLANGEFTDSAESFANTIYVGGKGTGSDRDIYEGESAIGGNSPSGFDRFEAWDNQSSMTVESEYEAEALSMLTQYGQTINVAGQGLAVCPYIFKEQYDIGDTITLAFSGKSAKAQILSVTEHWVWGEYGIEFSFGKPQNDLARQLQLILKQIQKASNKTTTTSSVKYYTIPTDTQMPKADVIYDTIGFVGDCGNGATFQLYLDDEKTGAKTYHVWFKQLAGSGKLTLTTGKAGASNLVMNSGTYVAIIYVDAEGNITMAGATTTDTIASGNNQPISSDGLANSNLNPVDSVTSGNTHSVTSNAVAEALKLYREKVVSKNQSAAFIRFSNYGVHVEEQEYPSTVENTWQPIISVSYSQDGKWNSAGFFKNLFCVGNNDRQCSVMLAELSTMGNDAPIVIKKKTVTGTTNPNGILYNGNSNLSGTEKVLSAYTVSGSDYKVDIGKSNSSGYWLQLLNYDGSRVGNTATSIEIYYI